MSSDYDRASFLAWEARAEDDLAAASVLLEHGGPYSTVCFLSQQLAEKYLKAYLLMRRQPLRRIHLLDK